MNDLYISIDPDRKHILSATATDVILLGRAIPPSDFEMEVGVSYTLDQLPPDESETCIVLVRRATYLAAISAWVDDKAGYYKRWNGEFCGVGNIAFIDPKLSDKSFHLNEYPDDDGEVITQTIHPPVYTATQFEIDMEHG